MEYAKKTFSSSKRLLSGEENFKWCEKNNTLIQSRIYFSHEHRRLFDDPTAFSFIIISMKSSRSASPNALSHIMHRFVPSKENAKEPVNSHFFFVDLFSLLHKRLILQLTDY